MSYRGTTWTLILTLLAAFWYVVVIYSAAAWPVLATIGIYLMGIVCGVIGLVAFLIGIIVLLCLLLKKA